MRPAPALAFASLLLAPPGAAQAPTKELAEVAAAYAAKVAASAIFVSGRTLDSVLAEELAPIRPLEALIRPLLRFEVDEAAGTVTCRLGQASATAVRTDGLGCTLALAPVTVAELRARTAPAPDRDGAEAPWPLGERLPDAPADGVDHAALAAVLDAAFAERDPERPVRTRAVVIVHRGALVAERYGQGYHADMPLPGWSMTKTLTHALLGVRERERPGRLAQVTARALSSKRWVFEEPPDGYRPVVTLDHLLTMTAGMAWDESYDVATSDVLTMLFRTVDHAGAYLHSRKGLLTEPGAVFVYSSGATNVLCRALRSTFDDLRDHHAFPRDRLFARLGMRSAVLETDPSGTFVGSSYGFASARDWARLGMLYAQRGRFAGEQVVPAEWIDAAFAPTPGSDGRFGRHLWLDRDPDGEGPRQREWPDLPEDLGCTSGHEGQYCFVFPGLQLVVVRLGCTKNGGFDLGALLRGAVAAVRG